MEELFVFAILLLEGIIEPDSSPNPYEQKRDALFLSSQPEDPWYALLLELEYETDLLSVVRLLENHFFAKHLDVDLFGQVLMAHLKDYYHAYQRPLKAFGCKMYFIWEDLPAAIQQQEPFFTLCYGDDPLSYQDEAQCRRLYEKMLSFDFHKRS